MLKEITTFGLFLFHASQVSTPPTDAHLSVVYTVIQQFVEEGGIAYHYHHAVDRKVHVCYEAFQNEAVHSSHLFQLCLLQPVEKTKTKNNVACVHLVHTLL